MELLSQKTWKNLTAFATYCQAKFLNIWCAEEFLILQALPVAWPVTSLLPGAAWCGWNDLAFQVTWDLGPNPTSAISQRCDPGWATLPPRVSTNSSVKTRSVPPDTCGAPSAQEALKCKPFHSPYPETKKMFTISQRNSLKTQIKNEIIISKITSSIPIFWLQLSTYWGGRCKT